MTPPALLAGDGGSPSGSRHRPVDDPDAASARTARREAARSRPGSLPVDRLLRVRSGDDAPDRLRDRRFRGRAATVRAVGSAFVATPRSIDTPPSTDTEPRRDG